VVIEVASAAGDHDAALYLAPISGIGMVKAGKKNKDKPTVADVLTTIAELIDARNA
jgi:formylmethanofuran dehydrogenase subunit B